VGGAGRRILLVDDEESVLFAIHAYLTLHGHEVHRASDRQTAERLLASTSFAGVVTDLNLTAGRDQEGFAVASACRKAGVERVVMLTAHKTPEVDATASVVGIDCVLAKPVLLSDLEQALLAVGGPP
jgi:DNA-binding response OmpR family regulator